MYQHKKTLSLILIIAMIFSTFYLAISSVSATTNSESGGTSFGLLGDVNLDESINIKDATMIQRYLAFLIELSNIQTKLADVDINGVSIGDVTWIQKYCAQLDCHGLNIGNPVYVEATTDTPTTVATSASTATSTTGNPTIASTASPTTIEPTEATTAIETTVTPSTPVTPTTVITSATTTGVPTTIEPTEITTAVSTTVPPTTMTPTTIKPTEITTAVPTTAAPTQTTSIVSTTVSPTQVTTANPTTIAPTETTTAPIGEYINYSYKITTSKKVVSVQAYLIYDKTKLQLVDKSYPSFEGCTGLFMENTDYNLGIAFNYTDTDDNIDYTSGANLITATFKVLDTSYSNPTVNVDVIASIDELKLTDNVPYSYIAFVNNKTVASGYFPNLVPTSAKKTIITSATLESTLPNNFNTVSKLTTDFISYLIHNKLHYFIKNNY